MNTPNFSDIYTLYFEDVYKYLLALCHDEELAEELAQDTFFKAMKSYENFRGDCKITTWLCQIAKHSFFLYEKHRKRNIDLNSVENEIVDTNSIEILLGQREQAFGIHIEYTFHAFCKIVIRNASYTALRTWSRKHKREIFLDYITDEKHYPLGTTDEYFKAPEPDEEYIVHLCGDTVILSNGLLVQALSRLPAQKQEMLYLSFFKRMPQHEIGRRYGRSRSAAGYHIRKAIQL